MTQQVREKEGGMNEDGIHKAKAEVSPNAKQPKLGDSCIPENTEQHPKSEAATNARLTRKREHRPNISQKT